MGTGSSKSSLRNHIRNSVDKNWETVKSGDSFHIVRHKTDNKQGEQFFYALDNRYDPSGEEYIFNKRNKAGLPLVRVLDHQWQAKGTALVPRNVFKVVTERLPHRLSACPQLTFDQALYVLQRCLEGFSYLYQSIGPFDINSNMIGFTPEGEVRLWLNENFGLNYPFHEKRTLQATRQNQSYRSDTDYVPLEQMQMVRNIVNVIEDRCEEGLFYDSFRDRIRKNIGFSEAKKVVREELENPQVVRLARVDLETNLVRSKISQSQKQTINQANIASQQPFVPLNTVTTATQPGFMTRTQPHQIQQQKGLSNEQQTKSAYSFSQRKVMVTV